VEAWPAIVLRKGAERSARLRDPEWTRVWFSLQLEQNSLQRLTRKHLMLSNK